MSLTSSFDKSVFWKPDGPVRQDLERALRAAAPSVLVYAERQAWIHHFDERMAPAILEAALDALSRRHASKAIIPAASAIQAGLRDEIRRFAVQSSRHRRKEQHFGSLFDLESLSPRTTPDYERKLMLGEFLALLSPSARHVANLVAAGYSWREIGAELDVAHSGIRRAFQKEADRVLRSLGITREIVKLTSAVPRLDSGPAKVLRLS